MSVRYVGVQWTRWKIGFDVVAVALIAAYLQLFPIFTRLTLHGAQSIDSRILGMRSWGSCAFLLLTVTLSIGPLARLNRRFLPILYNRRHLGVLLFGVAAYHAYQVLGYYFAYGPKGKIEALFAYDTAATGSSLPFTMFGMAALLIFFVMAVTSHDFWQNTLGPKLWKSLHMFVYVAYALVVLHVAFGPLQFERHPALVGSVFLSVLWVCGLHLVAGFRESKRDARISDAIEDGWVDAGPAGDIPQDGAIALSVPGREKIAVVRHGQNVSAVHGVCRHQQGPLTEGRVIDGCLTCPWHGWTYRPEDGCSPPPFTEQIPTYQVRLSKGGRVLVNPEPLPLGTKSEPVVLADAMKLEDG